MVRWPAARCSRTRLIAAADAFCSMYSPTCSSMSLVERLDVDTLVASEERSEELTPVTPVGHEVGGHGRENTDHSSVGQSTISVSAILDQT